MEETVNKQYIKGFNHAYFLAKYNPKLLDSLLVTKNDNQYFLGIEDGKVAYEKKKSKFRMNELEKLKPRGDQSRER